MADTALVIGGTRFIGRHLVSDLREHGYDVVTFSRGKHDVPYGDEVRHVRGDRKEKADLERARDEADPDYVFDMYGMYPREVREATDVFADVSAYVFVSSGSAYDTRETGVHDVPMREGETPLCPCTDEQAVDESMETYGNRKAECDREVFRAAEAGVNAVSVRPMLVYGEHDYTERFAYWVDRVAEYDRVVVPGDGGTVLHHAYVEDVASGLRIAAEEGKPGEAYNVADRITFSREDCLTLIADALDTDVDVVHASERELAEAGLEPSDFVLYTPTPAVAATEKLAALGWESTPLSEAISRTVAAHRENGRRGEEHDPGREAEERVIAALSE